MPKDSSQTYTSHRRYLVPWHFFAMPVISLHVLLQIRRLIQEPGGWVAWETAVTVAVFVAFLCARWMALRVQDRVVRLEERLRLERLLPGRGSEIARLSLRQLIGIRFASDAEAPALVDRMLAGELVTANDVKKEIRDWRPDHLRV